MLAFGGHSPPYDIYIAGALFYFAVLIVGRAVLADQIVILKYSS